MKIEKLCDEIKQREISCILLLTQRLHLSQVRDFYYLLSPDIKETVLGSAEIQKIFKVSSAGKIAGSKVISGEIKSKSKARIIRDGVVVYSGEILTIFREKNQVKEVGTGLECGISIKDYIDFKEKDVIESYLSEEIQRSI